MTDKTGTRAEGKTGWMERNSKIVDYDDDDDDDDIVAGILGEEMERLNSEADAILDSIRNEVVKSSSSSLDDDDYNNGTTVKGGDDMDDEMEDEMHDEILNLGSVTATLRQDLDEVSVESMASALSNTPHHHMMSPYHYYRYERKLLVSASEKYLREKKLYGPGVGGTEPNTPLLLFCILVWTTLIILIVHVRYGAMDEFGNLRSIPQFFQELMNQNQLV